MGQASCRPHFFSIAVVRTDPRRQATHAAQGPISSSVVLPGSCVPLHFTRGGQGGKSRVRILFPTRPIAARAYTPRKKPRPEREDQLGADHTQKHALQPGLNFTRRKLHADQNRRGKLIVFIRAPAFPPSARPSAQLSLPQLRLLAPKAARRSR